MRELGPLPSNISSGVVLPLETQLRFLLKLTLSTAMFEAFEMPATPSIIIWDKWTYANNQNGIRSLYYNRNKSDVSLGEIFRFNTCLVILTSITYWMPDFAILPDTFMKFRRLLWKEEVSSQSTSLKDKKMAISFLSRKKKKSILHSILNHCIWRNTFWGSKMHLQAN